MTVKNFEVPGFIKASRYDGGILDLWRTITFMSTFGFYHDKLWLQLVKIESIKEAIKKDTKKTFKNTFFHEGA